MDNFNLPYFSKSTTEFWRRWHISLGTWANDYLYKFIAPKYVRKYAKNGIFISLLLTFTIIGFWHGARWTYILFGMMHGLILGVEFLTKKRRKKFKKKYGLKIYQYGGWFITMVLWVISMILFRTVDLSQTAYFFKEIFWSSNFWNLRVQDLAIFSSIIIGVTILFTTDFFIFRKHTFHGLVRKKALSWHLSFILFFTTVIFLFGTSQGSQFIYFQF